MAAGRTRSPVKRSALPTPSNKPSPRSASPARPNSRSKSPSKPRSASSAAATKPQRGDAKLQRGDAKLAAQTAASSRTQLVLQLAVFLDLLGVMLVVPNLMHRWRDLGISTANLGVVSSVYSASQARPHTSIHDHPRPQHGGMHALTRPPMTTA